jgi:hypothetical protein
MTGPGPLSAFLPTVLFIRILLESIPLEYVCDTL